MSSSSPPKNPSPVSSGSASPDFGLTEAKSENVGNQEVSSEPQAGPSNVYSPQPLSSYDPHQPHLAPQPISSSQPNLDGLNMSLEMDPDTKQLIQSQGITIAEYTQQRRAFAKYEHPAIPNIYSGLDEETANVIHSEEMSPSDLRRQQQALDYFNRMKESLHQDPAGISRIESQIQEPYALLSNNSVLGVDTMGSYLDPNEELDPNDPFFEELADLVDPVNERIKACFGPEIGSTLASTSRVSAKGKTLIIKGPKPQSVKDTKSKISEGQPVPEIDNWPWKRKMTDTLPEAIEDKQSKRRKLLESPLEHGENQEEERCLLLFKDDENDDDYETLYRLYWYTLNQRTSIFQEGDFVQDFENGLTKYINEFLDSKITTEQCKKKVMELRKKYLYFMELNGYEDFNEADFSVPREYKMFQMFKIVWGADPGHGGSCSVAGQGVNVGNPLQGAVDNMNVDQGHVAEPIPPALTNVSGAGKAPEPANVKSGAADKELEADMARAVSNSLKEVRDPSADQKDDNMDIDSTNPEH